MNIGIEAIIGAIPLVGDIFDLVFRANNRNMTILKKQFKNSNVSVSPRSRWFQISVVIAFIVLTLSMVYFMVLAVSSLLKYIF